ncbi:MAG: UPF0158 family protein [Vulcanimicrobiota bacterium]
MKKKIEYSALCTAYNDSRKEIAYFLDKETGEIITVSLSNPDVQTLKKLKEKITLAPSRYPQIPHRSPHESYKDMESFIKTLKDIKLQKRLVEAIEGQGAFKCFRDVLEAYPREKKAWNDYRESLIKKSLNDFLKSIGVPESDRFQ